MLLPSPRLRNLNRKCNEGVGTETYYMKLLSHKVFCTKMRNSFQKSPKNVLSPILVFCKSCITVKEAERIQRLKRKSAQFRSNCHNHSNARRTSLWTYPAVLVSILSIVRLCLMALRGRIMWLLFLRKIWQPVVLYSFKGREYLERVNCQVSSTRSGEQGGKRSVDQQ